MLITAVEMDTCKKGMQYPRVIWTAPLHKEPDVCRVSLGNYISFRGSTPTAENAQSYDISKSIIMPTYGTFSRGWSHARLRVQCTL